MTATAEQKLAVKKCLVRWLRLKMDPAEIDDAGPLFGEGLGLDSVDALEIVSGLEKEFDVVVASQDEGQKVMGSVEALAAFLVEKGAL